MASARTSVLAIAIVVQVALLQAQPATSAAKFADLPPRQRFVAWALRYQWWLARDKPVTQAPWPGSASSGISVAYGFFDTPSTRSVAAVPLRQRVYHQVRGCASLPNCRIADAFAFRCSLVGRHYHYHSNSILACVR